MGTHDKRSLQEWAVGREADQAILAIGFTDICDSTLLNRQLGDARMSEVRDAHFARSRTLCEAYHGYVVKSMGDGLLVVFHAASAALDFMLALLTDTGDRSINLHAGLHVGPVVITDDDVYGDTVNYAARLTELAKRNEILVSTSFKTHIDTYYAKRAKRRMELKWEQRGIRQLKGFSRQLIWSVEPESTHVIKAPSQSISDKFPDKTVNVELTIDCDFDSFSSEEKARVLHTLKELLDSPNEIAVASIKPGS